MHEQMLQTRLMRFVNDLADETTRARATEQMQAYLDFVARFRAHGYSWGNLLLIYWSMPHATLVAGRRQWEALSRKIKDGEPPIAILAPRRQKVTVRAASGEDEEVVAMRGVLTVHVYDVSQTCGAPLPPMPDWKSPARHEQLQQQLLAFAAAHGIQVQLTDLHGDTQGASYGGGVALSPVAGTKTLIHELAHERALHHHAGLPRRIVEVEAEAVAYIVARHYGIADLHSANYLALFDAGAGDIRARLATILRCAEEIILWVEPRFIPVFERPEEV
jgi:hypothetical protein